MSPQEILSVKQRFGIIGNSPHLNYAIQVAVQVAATDMTVMISGESGSGKESFSKIIHALSARKHNTFIAINCGAIPEGTIDSELFGHEKGSFTGAVDARKGYFEVTNGGTIFLDEIGEMPLGTQARLLRVLENGEFIRVGSSKVQKTDVRVVAATNVNLLDAVHKGRFREDLYYRLSTVPIAVPPLRERGQDIELLFRKFATDFAEKYRVRPVQLEPDAIQALLSYAWPGNIRQLKNIAEQVSILEIERMVSADSLRRYLPQNRSTLPMALGDLGRTSNGAESFSERDLLYKVLFDMRKDMTDLKQMVLQLAQGGVDSAAVLETHKALFDEVQPATTAKAQPAPLYPTSNVSSNGAPLLLSQAKDEDVDVEFATQDIDHDLEEENLSLERKEKELIIKALTRNANKRKQAARELGISERTLYRKIKQYAIE
jgi:transcriptional regulator with PAS, ATPase and Fis domain